MNVWKGGAYAEVLNPELTILRRSHWEADVGWSCGQVSRLHPAVSSFQLSYNPGVINAGGGYQALRNTTENGE